MLEQFLLIGMCQNNPIMEKLPEKTCIEAKAFYDSYGGSCETKCIKIRGGVKETLKKAADKTSKLLDDK